MYLSRQYTTCLSPAGEMSEQMVLFTMRTTIAFIFPSANEMLTIFQFQPFNSCRVSLPSTSPKHAGTVFFTATLTHTSFHTVLLHNTVNLYTHLIV